MAGMLGLGLLLWAYGEATAEPVVRRASVDLADWPAGQPPVTLLLVSDIHVAGPDMPPERLRRIVGQINALGPDLVLIAGDLVSDKMVATRRYSPVEAIAPLSGLRPRIGSYAVLGNHDHWRDGPAMRGSLEAAGIKVLDNEAVAAGPLVIGGLDDDFTDHADIPKTFDAMRRLSGARILLSHSPDPFLHLPAGPMLMLAGHTHCGQIALPFIGPLATASEHGRRYACGIVNEGGKTLIVGAGLGTSMLPLRIGAVPDMWLIRLSGGPAKEPRPAASR